MIRGGGIGGMPHMHHASHSHHIAFIVHGVEGHVLQKDFLPRGKGAHVQQHIRTFSRGKKQTISLLRCRQKAPIVANQGKGKLFVVHNKRKVINAGRGTVEQTEAVNACRSFEGWGALAVDKYGVAQIAHHQIVPGRRIVQAAIVGKALVLNYNGDISLTQTQIEFLGKGLFLGIPYYKEGCQPHVCLFCGQAMWMWVVPVSTRPICDGEGVVVTVLGLNGI